MCQLTNKVKKYTVLHHPLPHPTPKYKQNLVCIKVQTALTVIPSLNIN